MMRATRSGSDAPHRRFWKAVGLLAGFTLLAGTIGWAVERSASEMSGTGTDGAANQAEADPVVLVTGSTSGLGREVALRLAAQGAHVIVHGRNRERGQAVVEQIEASGSGSARFYAADFASLDEVRAFGEAVLRDYDRLDVLVNNAGVWLRGAEEPQLSEDGHEMHFAVNYLAGYVLGRMLLPRLRESAPARIIHVASVAQSPIDFDDVMLERPGAASRGYGQSKLAQIMFTFDLAEELEGTGVIAAALHPATMMDTRMVREVGARPRTTVDEGADALMHLIKSPEVENGRYYNGTRPARANDQAYDEEARERLRRLSRELTGID